MHTYIHAYIHAYIQAGTEEGPLGASPLSALRLRSLCDGPFMRRDSDGDATDGVEVEALRE